MQLRCWRWRAPGRRVRGCARFGAAGARLTTFDLDDYIVAAFRAGASGFLLKTAPPQQLVAAVRTVYAGDALLVPASTRRLIEQFARPPGQAPGSTC